MKIDLHKYKRREEKRVQQGISLYGGDFVQGYNINLFRQTFPPRLIRLEKKKLKKKKKRSKKNNNKKEQEIQIVGWENRRNRMARNEVR
jgi:hypothetical protein